MFLPDPRKYRNLALFLFSLTVAPASFAQSEPSHALPPQTPAIKVRTGLVLIPAEVTDSKGNRVTDLQKEDFVVLENGKRQEIAMFEHVRTKPEMMQQSEVEEGEFTNGILQHQDRVTIFVLDLLNSGLEEQREARKELIDFLSKSLNMEEPLCLIVVDGNGAWLIHNFTTDPSVLIEALNKVKSELSDKDRPAKNPAEEIYRGVQGWNGKNPGANAAMQESRINMLRLTFGLNAAVEESRLGSVLSDVQSVGLAERIRLTLLALMEIGDAFAGIPGRKSLIWATAGFPFPMDDSGAFGAGGNYQRLGDHGYRTLYERTWRALNAANIAVYPLDVSELVNPGYVSVGIGAPLPQHVATDLHVANLESFADVTGGKFCERSMDARKCFDLAAGDSSDYYLLGIYDRSGAEKPGWRKLSVRTYRTGLKVRARSGYYLGGATHEKPSDTRQLEMALFSPLDYTGLLMKVKLSKPTEGSKPEAKRVRFVYTIPPSAVQVDEENGNQLHLQFGAVARDSGGKMIASFRKIVNGELSDAQKVQVREKGIVFIGAMNLVPGEYTLTFAAMDTVNGNIGTLSAPLKVE